MQYTHVRIHTYDNDTNKEIPYNSVVISQAIRGATILSRPYWLMFIMKQFRYT